MRKRKNHRSIDALAGLLAVTLLLTGSRAFGADVWDGAAFSGDPKEIAAAAKLKVEPRERGVVVLLDERRIVFDDSHRAVDTHRLIYRIGTTSPEDWAVATATWQP